MTAPRPTLDHAATPILQDFPPVLNNRNFLLLWGAYIVSALGDRIQMLVALHLLCHKILGLSVYPTQQNAQLTIAMLAPFALLGPFMGILADRLPRRTVMITADVLRAVIIIAVRTLFVTALPHMSTTTAMALLFGSELAMASCSAMFAPARSALLPNLVHPNQLLQAQGLISAAGSVASLLGFVVGGYMIGHSENIAMYAGAVTFAISALFIVLMKPPPAPRFRNAADRPRSSPLGDLAAGIRYIARHRHVLQVIVLMLVFWSVGTLILNGLSGIITIDFGLNEEWYAYFLGFVGLGMIAGAASVNLVQGNVPKELGIAWPMVGVGVLVFAFSFVPGGTGPLGMKWWVGGLILLMGAAFLGAVLLVSLETLLARITPDYVRGRVMGVKDVATTAGLLVPIIPLALYPGVDKYMRPVLGGMAVFVFAVGAFLVIHYYRRQPIPWKAAILFRLGRMVLVVLHRYRRVGPCRIPVKGRCIVVANHRSAIDPVVLGLSSPYRIVHFMMAKEYYNVRPFHYLYKALGVVPVNRTGNDTASVRTVLRMLEDGECIGMFPEGRISLDGEMQDAKPGVAMLALMSGATVVPAYISGMRPHQGMVKDILVPSRIRIRYGTPLQFEKDAAKARDADARQQVTDQIMAAIIALRDKARASGEDRPGPQAAATHRDAGAAVV